MFVKRIIHIGYQLVTALYWNIANKNRFGDKSHRTKKKDSDEESDRTKDKDDFDGTSSSLPENSIVNKNVDDGSYLS